MPEAEDKGRIWKAIAGAVVVMAVMAVATLADRFNRAALPPTPTAGALVSPIGSPTAGFTSPLNPPAPGAFDSPLPVLTPMTQVVYRDDFSDPASGWREGPFGDSEYRYENGEYVILVKKEKLAAWSLWSKQQFTDLTLEADTRLVKGAQKGETGVVFRFKDKDNYYFLLLSGYGQYVLGKNENGKLLPIAIKRSASFKGDETNRLKIVCQGTHTYLYVNDHYLDTMEDASFSEGKIGLFAMTEEGSGAVKATFDNLVVSVAGAD